MINAIAPWYGSDRMICQEIGYQVGAREWVGIPFGGGMSALVYINARTIVVGDKHRDVINLARVIADRALQESLVNRIECTAFHPDELRCAQERCLALSQTAVNHNAAPSVQWAADYFICVWMGRSGVAGTPSEFKGGISTRWEAGGGDSVVRFRNASQSLHEWHRTMLPCGFVCCDAFEFLSKCKDNPKHALYVDPPFPGPGNKYTHKFTPVDHQNLASLLRGFKHTRVVCRFYEHEMVEELYNESCGWKWNRLVGRKQTNDAAPELLITLN